MQISTSNRWGHRFRRRSSTLHPYAAKTAVPTQLPPDKAVTAPDSAQLARNNAHSENQRLSRQVVIDRAAAQIVYQTVDSRTSVVVSQFPDEAQIARPRLSARPGPGQARPREPEYRSESLIVQETDLLLEISPAGDQP